MTMKAARWEGLAREFLAAGGWGMAVMFVLCLMLRFALSTCSIALLRNDSPSVPVGFYRERPLVERDLRHGTLVAFLGVDSKAPAALRNSILSGQRSARWKHEMLIKIVAGGAGDLVTYERGLVHVDGVALPYSKVQSVDHEGDPLPQVSFPVRLARGQVWLTSLHDDGFDSRYYGPVSVTALRAIVERLHIP